MENNVINQTDLKALTQAYLDAFHARDLERCVEFFADEATIDFNRTMYTGRKPITEWHQDRFAVDFKIIKVDSMTADGDTVTVEGAVTSKKLASWRVKALNGKVAITFAGGKITNGKLSPRMTNPFNMLREDLGAW